MSSPDDTLGRLNAALAGRYVVEGELGRGGMATVYLAEDLAHGRKVAIKVLSPDVAHALGSERFLKEIEVAAGLTHPHILPLFDSGEADGLLYYVMPHVEEEPLRERLHRERQLPLEEVIRIVGEVADALSHAHEQRLIHRDIKPENILFSAGHALVADFGIAKGLDAAGGEQLTRTGVTVGTPAYMSPEQAGGAAELDGRSDLYSLGCVAYEMLAGQPPFTAPTPQAFMARHAVDPVPELTTVRPDIPAGVSRAVHKALAKAPADRHSSAREFADALREANTEEAKAVEAARRQREARQRRLGWAFAVMVAMAVGAWVASAIAGPAYERLAVLPPTNLSNNPEGEGLILGVHDAMIGELQKAGITVKARTSVMRYRDGNTPIREIADDVGVDALIEPAVRWTDDSVEVDVRLVDGNSEEYIANPIVERAAIQNVLGMYRILVRRVAEELELNLSPEAEARLASARTVDPQAYRDYLNGQFHWSQLTPGGLETALGYFQQALGRDPDFAPAQAGIALVWVGRQQMGLTPPSEAAPRAQEALTRAMARDSTSFEVQYAAALVRTWVDWDWDGGEAAFLKAIELNPNYAELRAYYAHLLAILGRGGESDREMARALELDPVNPLVLALYGQTLVSGGHHEEAIDFFQDALRGGQENLVALEGIAVAFHQQGMEREALEQYGRFFPIFGLPDFPDTLMARFREEGPKAAWLLAARTGAELPYFSPMQIAQLFDFAGETEQALSWLERAIEVRDPNAPYLNAQAFSEALKTHPRFRNLQRRMNLPAS